MKKLIPIIVVVIVAVGGYFGLTAAGILGSSVLSKEKINEVLVAWADEINAAEGGLDYDGYSRLVRAEVVQQTINIVGKTTKDKADIRDGYFDSREPQARGKLCADETMKAAIAGFAAFNFAWFSNDDQLIGSFKIRNKKYCSS